MENQEIWLQEGYRNKCVSGSTKNTIYRYYGSDEQAEYFRDYLLPEIRKIIVPYKGKYLRDKDGVSDIVNDAVECAREGSTGYLFNLKQVKLALELMPTAKIEYREGVYTVE